MNVVVPGKTDEDEYSEHPIPEQYISKFNEEKRNYTTECMAHTG